MISTTLDDLLRDQRLLEARIRFAVIIGITPPPLPRPKVASAARTTPSSLGRTRKSSAANVCNSARLSV
jgi:hypothetical protein